MTSVQKTCLLVESGVTSVIPDRFCAQINLAVEELQLKNFSSINYYFII